MRLDLFLAVCSRHVAMFAALALVLPVGSSGAGDDSVGWRDTAAMIATYRGDAGRRGVRTRAFRLPLRTQWQCQLASAQPAWPGRSLKIAFDWGPVPIVDGTQVYVASPARSALDAFDLATGKKNWTAYADGPIRFAPLVVENRVYFVSDDGCLHCVDAANGERLWRVAGKPHGRLTLGNEHLISAWPARGAPVYHDGTVAFAAGIFPWMGIFIRAVDAKTGRELWCNSGEGERFLVQQHNSPAFAGIAPQGYLATDGELLLVPGGLTVPGGFDWKSGAFRFFDPSRRTLGKDAGGFEVAMGPNWYANRGGWYDASTGEPKSRFPQDIVITADAVFAIEDGNLVCRSATPVTRTETQKDRRGRERTVRSVGLPEHWRVPLPSGTWQLRALAGAQFVLSSGDRLALVTREETRLDIKWKAQLSSDIFAVDARDGWLCAATMDGRITVFADQTKPRPEPGHNDAPQVANSNHGVSNQHELTALVARENRTTAGYGLIVGAAAPELIRELQDHTLLNWTVLVRGHQAAERLRRSLDAVGLLGPRCSVREWGPTDILPPYVFRTVIVLDSIEIPTQTNASAEAKQLADAVRPYGGQLCVAAAFAARIAEGVRQTDGHWREMGTTENWRCFARIGALPGSGSWTHQSCDATNALVSDESRVQLPLGTLWYGGPTNEKILPRHGHGPTPQVVGGRVIMEGPDILRAIDVYSGTLLWEAEFPGIGDFYNTTSHHPGAGAIGSNYVSMPDRIYVLYHRACHILDPTNGEVVQRWELPPDKSGRPAIWGWAACRGRYLVAAAEPVASLTRAPARRGESDEVVYAEGSRFLYVLDRMTGAVLWSREASFNFRHNAIAVGDESVYVIDGITAARRAQLERRGETPAGQPVLLALDLATGKPRWSVREGVFGTWLGYFAPRNVLLEAGSRNRDRARDEVGRGMSLYDAATGRRLWHHDHVYAGPPMLHDRMIIAQGQGFDWKTGEPYRRRDSITGEPIDWLFRRGYGCDSAIGCQNLLTFRSAAAGFFDLANDGGTGNFGGFRTSCTPTLIPADGVIASPDFTRTCVCSYQQRTSLGLVTMPELDYWTYAGTRSLRGDRVRRLGLNFGAPGDRREADGTLWLDYPPVGGDSPQVPVEVEGDDATFYRHHPLLFRGERDWVVASGVEGVHRVTIGLIPPVPTGAGAGALVPSAEYEVELWFAEPRVGMERGRREFSVRLNGKLVAEGLNIASRAGGVRRACRLDAGRHRLAEQLVIEFAAARGSTFQPILSGVKLWQVDEGAAGN